VPVLFQLVWFFGGTPAAPLKGRHTLPIIFKHNKDKLKVLYLEEGNGYITDQ
jgi:hypothetical protein